MRIANELTALAGHGAKITGGGRGTTARDVGSSQRADFASVLSRVASRVKFSQHAEARMQSRGLTLSDLELEKLGQALDKMQAKGAKEALIYLRDGAAMVVSVTNRTVITALDDSSATDNIFTNIDSAAII